MTAGLDSGLTRRGLPLMPYTLDALSPRTWPAYAALIERHGGVWGGCWCLAFHADGQQRGPERQERKRLRVCNGTAQAALVFDAERCIGWCQFGSPVELPRIKHRRAYEQVAAHRPDWRITCFFVDREYRGRGVSSLALSGALAQIEALGGGSVESFPEQVEGRTVSASFLHNGRLAMFERQGFRRVAPLGKHHWLVSREVGADAQAAPVGG